MAETDGEMENGTPSTEGLEGAELASEIFQQKMSKSIHSLFTGLLVAVVAPHAIQGNADIAVIVGITFMVFIAICLTAYEFSLLQVERNQDRIQRYLKDAIRGVDPR